MEPMPSSTGNKLERWVGFRDLDGVKVMNVLQDYGVVSDNAVHMSDVANDEHAVDWLVTNFHIIHKLLA
jgi:hypothetical protein